MKKLSKPYRKAVDEMKSAGLTIDVSRITKRLERLVKGRSVELTCSSPEIQILRSMLKRGEPFIANKEEYDPGGSLYWSPTDACVVLHWDYSQY